MAEAKSAALSAAAAPSLFVETVERVRPDIRLIGLPRSAGMASGLMVGLAMGTGGVAVTVLGWLADRWGVPAALWVSALLPVTGFVAAQFLPAPRDREIVTA